MLKEFKTLVPYFKKYFLYYLAGLFFLVITDAGQLYIPQLIRRAIDIISSGNFDLSGILIPAAQMIAIAIVIVIGRFSWRYFIHGSSRRIEQELREKLFVHLQSLSSTFYGKAKTGDLMARFTNDMHAIRMASGMALVAFIDGFFMTLAILAILFSQNPRLTLYSIMPLPIITVGVIFFGRIIGEQFRRVQEGFSNLSEMAQESITGIRVIKTFVQEKAFVKRFMDTNQDYSDRNMAVVRTWGFFFPLVAFLAGITSLIFLFLGGRAVIEGSLSPGEFTAFLAYLKMLVWPMLGAGFTINLIQRAGASLGRINRILNEKPDISSPPHAVRDKIDGNISFRSLTFSYPDTHETVLSDISLEIPTGSVLGILGKTASGKSTLVQLLPRILDPPEGTVFIDGKDVRSFDLGTLRSAIGMVPQDNFLFSTTIRENIAFGTKNGQDDLIKKVACISTIDRDFNNFPEGWDTVVGERGISLSGGQKQRVSISRSLAADASIYIFDDSLSSVDTETEDFILRELIPFIRGKTAIIISHRISTLKMSNKIIVMDNGKITQKGSHDELLAEKGFYAEIYKLQQLEESMRKNR